MISDSVPMMVTVNADGRGVACTCLEFHHRFLCRHIFAVLKWIVDREDEKRDALDELSSEEYGRRIVELIGCTYWLGSFRHAALARAVGRVASV